MLSNLLKNTQLRHPNPKAHTLLLYQPAFPRLRIIRGTLPEFFKDLLRGFNSATAEVSLENLLSH